MKKKFLFLLVASLFIVTMTAGCGAPATQQTDPAESSASENSVPAESSTAADAETTTSEGKYRIGLSLNDMGHKWVSGMVDALNEWIPSQPNVELIFGDSAMDSQKQIQDVENWITQKFDLIIVKPVEAPAAKALAVDAAAAGIPYISMEEKMDEAVASVMQDNIVVGETQMEAVLEMIGYEGNVIIMTGAEGAMVGDQRIEGNKNKLAEYPEVKLVAEDTGEWYRDKALALTETWVQAGTLKDVDAIVCCNDEMAIGTSLALEEAGLTGTIVVAGIDGTLDALEYVQDGKMQITLFADAPAMGIGALECALKGLETGTFEDVILYNDVVTIDNVADYISRVS